MNNGELNIDHDIPMPLHRRKTTPLSKALDKMKVGDSIVIPKIDRNKAISGAYYRDKRVSTREITPDLIRVWVTEVNKTNK